MCLRALAALNRLFQLRQETGQSSAETRRISRSLVPVGLDAN